MLIVLIFGIKFRKTKQKEVALVATALKALISVSKTNDRISGSEFYTGRIYHLFKNIFFTHVHIISI